MQQPVDRLTLVYDAESGTVGALVDSAKKLLRINGCELCSLTHGLVSERQEWRSCRDEIGVPVDSLHRDDMPPAIHRLVAGRLPCILATAAGETLLLLGPDAIARCRGSVADLRGKLVYHAAQHGLTLEKA